MANYKILIKPSAIKELNKIPKKYLSKITDMIQALAIDPRPPDCEKLAAKNAFRARQGVYRIVYSIEDDSLIIVAITIGNRRDVYK